MMAHHPTHSRGRRAAFALAGCVTAAWIAVATPSPALANGQGVHAEPDWPSPVMEQNFGRVMIDRFEFAAGEGADTLTWDAQAWYGGNTERVWFETEGDAVLDDGDGGELEGADVFYSRAVSAFWDARAGVGYQRIYGPGPDRDRAYAVAGVQGLAPYWLETEANLRLSEDGDAWLDGEVEYDMLLTQRLVLQPRLETAIAFQDTPAFEQGSGITGITTGLRLRYELSREVAPYAGVSWQRDLGDTADLTEAEGGDTSRVSAVVGLRVWF